MVPGYISRISPILDTATVSFLKISTKILGIKLFKKPFKIDEIFNWLDQIEGSMDPKRELSNWFLKRIPKKSGD